MPTYTRWSKIFDRRFDTTFALYGASALAIGAGIVLRYTVFQRKDAQVSIVPQRDGALVCIKW